MQQLKKLPISPTKYKAREILQKCGLSFASANALIWETIAKDENKTIEEIKKTSWHIKPKVWSDILNAVIYKEDLYRIGYE